MSETLYYAGNIAVLPKLKNLASNVGDSISVIGNSVLKSNVLEILDASSNTYINSRRVPAGSLQVSSYVTGSVPLTTTTNLIQNYLGNAASITSNTGTGTITQALTLPGTNNSGVFIPNGGSSISLLNPSTSNIFIEAWVNPSVVGASNYSIFARANAVPNFDFGLYIASSSLTGYIFNTASTNFVASNSTAVSAGTWYHLAMSYVSSTGVLLVFTNGGVGGTTATLTGTPRFTTNSNVYVGYDPNNSNFYGNVADVRVWSGGIVPTATFAPAAAPFGSTQPSYITGTPTLLMSLNSQYFPGASTSPYGPCLTLPGTVGSYYSEVNTAFDTNWKTNGFCVEAWVNYASFANSNVYNAASIPLLIGHYAPTGASTDWGFGATITGQLAFWYYNGGAGQGVTSSAGALATGQWTHIVVQSNGTNIWLAVNGTFVSGAGTAISGTPVVTAGTALTVGQLNNNQGPNFAIAKARLTFGTSGNPALGNVYSSGNFTASPNFAAVPNGATVAWQLETQFPLPTYPYIQDVTELPQQASSYGSLLNPVGGVTSNSLSPYSATYPQLQSVRFDGTGYVDYGNVATSLVTTNLWANSWTIEGWVYQTNLTSGNVITKQSDWSLTLNNGSVFFNSPGFAPTPASAYTYTSSTSVSPVYVTTDSTSNIYIIGNYTAGFNIYTFTSTPTTSGYSVPSGSGMFLVKYSQTGSVLGFTYISGTISAKSLAIDAGSNIYVAGNYSGTPTINTIGTSPTSTGTALPSVTNGSCAISYSQAGTLVGYTYYTGTNYIESITTDAQSNIYLGGSYTGATGSTIYTFGTSPTSSSLTLPTNSGNSNVFIVKYLITGTVAGYTTLAGGAGSGEWANSVQCLSIDPGSNLCVAGEGAVNMLVYTLSTSPTSTGYTIPSNPNGKCPFLIKFNQAGNILAYARPFAANSSAAPGSIATSFAFDSLGNMYVAAYQNSGMGGTFAGLTTFSLTPTATASYAPTGPGSYLIKYNAAGTILGYAWVPSATLQTALQTSVAVDTNNNVFFTGQYASTSTVPIYSFNNLPAIISAFSLPGTSASNSTSFVIKFNSTGYVMGVSYIIGSSGSSTYTPRIASDLGGNLYSLTQYSFPASVNIQNMDSGPTPSSFNLPSTSSLGLVKYSLTSNNIGTFANTWNHIFVSYDGTYSNIGVNGSISSNASTQNQSFNPLNSIQIGSSLAANMADVRISNVARYTGTSYTVPSGPFAADANTLLLLRSNVQTSISYNIQSRGINAISQGGTRTVQPYPPAPMSSYLLDTTSNASVSYGQGKYVASASSDQGTNFIAWQAFNRLGAATSWACLSPEQYSTTGSYLGSTTVVDTLGNSYSGAWLQLQLPVSVVLSNYTLTGNTTYYVNYSPSTFSLLGSRDGINWTLVDSRSGITWASVSPQTFTVSATQAYNFYKLSVIKITGGSSTGSCVLGQLLFNGTEEALCVTSDAKVGVGVANPQRSLEVAGDLVTGGTVSAGNPLMYRNRVINGDMRIAQRGAGPVYYTSATSLNSYLIDRFYLWTNSGLSGNVSYAQTLLSTSDTPYQYGFRYTANVVVNSVTTATSINIGHGFEGYSIQDFNWGTSFGSPVTLSFWFKSNLPTGSTFCFQLDNYGLGTQNYTSNWTSIQNTWQYLTFTIPPPANGSSWATGASGSLTIWLCYYAPTSSGGVFNAWSSSAAVAGITNWIANAGNYINITGVQLEKGTVATPFEVRPYATELALCQRYFETSFPQGTTPAQQLTTGGMWLGTAFASGQLDIPVQFQVRKRVAPTTVTLYRPSTVATGTWAYAYPGTGFAPISPTTTAYETGMYLEITGGTSAVGSSYFTTGNWAVSAEL